MVTEAIILAGGMGTRLREAVPDLPKCMANVAGQPFLYYVINYLRMQGIERFIFSLGYKAHVITTYLQEHYPTLDYTTVVEDEPLGTGGAIQFALQNAITSDVLVANGDTLFEINLQSLTNVHINADAECTLALKPMKDFDRYGVVETGADGKITSFKEKQYYPDGHINGGIYLVKKIKFFNRNMPVTFSFEKDYLERFYGEGSFYGSLQDGYFIDIGIPDDYRKASSDLQRKKPDISGIDKSWTLFLDRDGVINEEIEGNYIKHWKEFIFSNGVLEVFKKLSEKFGRIIVVSNQRGVGKGLMTEASLQSIHLEMQREVEIVGGRIDKLYYCTDKEETSFNRKPNPGMAMRAYRDFPDIDFRKAIMVGNKLSDMKFGRAAGMLTAYVKTTHPDQQFPHPDIDFVFDSLSGFAEALQP